MGQFGPNLQDLSLLFVVYPPQGASPKTRNDQVITLPEGRCFMNRELLLKGHPRAYDPKDADPLRHVISCIKLLGCLELFFFEQLRFIFFPSDLKDKPGERLITCWLFEGVF